jgi:acyl-CoA oxidase
MFLGREIRDRVDRLHTEDVEDLHYQTVGAKIWATEHATRDAEVARLACGGHGG